MPKKQQQILLPKRKCIYCLVEKKSNQFNKEHVIPQLMGRYENGLTIKSVCEECNKYFGDNLDPVFAEDTYEAILRASSGIKSPSAIEAMRWERVRITVPPGNWWSGAKLKLVFNGERMVLDLLPQIGFFSKSTNRYEFFTLQELHAMPDLSELDVKNFKLVAANQEHEDSLKEFCNTKFGLNVSFTRQSEPLPVTDGDLDVELESRIDDLVKRAVCKIAFNYLAKFIPVNNREFLLDPLFDDIRNYVRAEQKLPPDRIVIRTGNENSILQLPPNVGLYAHLIVLEHQPDRSLRCRFSPYDHLHYEVILARNLDKVVEQIGHAFYYRENPLRCEQLGIASSAAK